MNKYKKPILTFTLYYWGYDKPLTNRKNHAQADTWRGFSEYVIKFFLSKVIRKFLLPNYIGTYIHRGTQACPFQDG